MTPDRAPRLAVGWLGLGALAVVAAFADATSAATPSATVTAAPSHALVRSAEAPPRVSRFGAYSGYSAATYDGWQRSSQYVTVRDGTRLAIDLLRPTRAGVLHDERLPVVWTATPYRRAVAEEGVIYTILDTYPWLAEVMRHGYVVGVLEVRGTGASFGRFAGMFSDREADDLHDVNEWLAAQPWSSGRIGMYGQSYLAITQYRVASRRPPHLVALMPSMGLTDVYDFVHKGGIDHTPLLRSWGERLHRRDVDLVGTVPVDGDGDRKLLAAALAEHAGNANPGETYAAAPFRDSVDAASGVAIYREWTPLRGFAELRASAIPIYHLAGWYDRYLRDQVALFHALPNPQRITIGPWTHGAEDETLDQAAEHLRWWDHWLKGIDNGVMAEPPVHYYLLGAPPAEAWRSAATWPLPQERRQHLLLAGGPSGSAHSLNDGRLTVDDSAELAGGRSAAGAEGVDRLPVDRAAGVAGNPRWTTEPAIPDLRANEAHALTFTTAPQPAAVELVGHPVAHLWVSSSGRDGDLFVYLSVVDAEGVSRYLSEGMLRLSGRATVPALYAADLGLPYHRGERGDRQPMRPGEPEEVAVELFPIALRLAPGERLRFTVTGADAPNTRPLGVDPADPTPVLSVWRGGDRRSRIELPVIAGELAPARTRSPPSGRN